LSLGCSCPLRAIFDLADISLRAVAHIETVEIKHRSDAKRRSVNRARQSLERARLDAIDAEDVYCEASGALRDSEEALAEAKQKVREREDELARAEANRDA
jgi:hypothetical protein